MGQSTESRRYMGRRFNQGKMRWWWQHGSGEDIRVHKRAPQGPTPIGSTWSFTTEEDGTFYVSGEFRPVMESPADPQDPQVVMWTTLDRVAMVEKAERSTAAMHVKNGDFEAILRPIRELYWPANKTTRTAIIAAVITEITTI